MFTGKEVREPIGTPVIKLLQVFASKGRGGVARDVLKNVDYGKAVCLGG